MAETSTQSHHETSTFTVRDGTELFSQEWTVASPKAVVILVHGFGEHSTRYTHVAEHFNVQGFSVYTYDQRSHGNSPGKKGDIPSFDPMASDLEEFLGDIRTRVGDTPIFLFGHSMGGLVLALFVIKYAPDVRGLIFSSAGVKADDNTSALMRKVAGLLARFLPDVPVHELDIDGLSRIPEVVQRYKDDPLVYHGKIGARSGNSFMKAIDHVTEHMAEIALPLLALHGTKDRLVSSAASELLYAECGSQDRSLKLYEGAYHEVFNDLGAEEFMTDTIDWIKAHL